MKKGIYVLVISIGKDVNLKVGALGSVRFEKGLYAYVGSAQNNLEKRIERHLGKVKRKFWHIDYFLDADCVDVVGVFQKNSGKSCECEIAERIDKEEFSIEGFGSSDCRCRSHLFKLESCQFLRAFMCETLPMQENVL